MNSLRRCIIGIALGLLSWLSPAYAQTGFDRAALIEAARKEGKLVFYATMPEEQVSQLLKQFTAKYPFIDTGASFRATSGRLKARLDAEIASSRIQGDVLQMGSFGQFLAYAKAGRLDRFETPEMSAYPPNLKEQGLWTVFRSAPIVMSYNPGKLPDADAPKAWSDLSNPKFAGKLAFIESTSGGQHVHWYVLREKYGPDFWKKLAPSKPVALAGPNQVMDGLLTGEYLLAGHTYGYTVKEYQANKAPLKAILPSDGIPMLVTAIGVIKDGPNPNAARLFIDWILSKEGQTAIVNIMGDYSPRADVPPPEGMPSWDKVNKLIPDSWEKLLASTGDFTRDWDEMTGKRK
jgi:iron(III) transport system substrate-binding protein